MLLNSDKYCFFILQECNIIHQIIRYWYVLCRFKVKYSPSSSHSRNETVDREVRRKWETEMERESENRDRERKWGTEIEKESEIERESERIETETVDSEEDILHHSWVKLQVLPRLEYLIYFTSRSKWWKKKVQTSVTEPDHTKGNRGGKKSVPGLTASPKGPIFFPFARKLEGRGKWREYPEL